MLSFLVAGTFIIGQVIYLSFAVLCKTRKTDVAQDHSCEYSNVTLCETAGGLQIVNVDKMKCDGLFY